MSDFPLVLVTWHDAETQHGWESVSDARVDTIPACVSVGFVIKKTRKEIVLAQTIARGELNGRITIPRGWVVGNIIALRRPK